MNERKLFSYSSGLQNEFNDLYKKSFKMESRIEKMRYYNMKSGSIVTLLIIAIIVLVLLYPLGTGEIGIGMFIALVNAIFSLVQTMSWRLFGTLQEYSRIKEYIKDVNTFFGLSEKKDALTKSYCLGDFEFETIEFVNVSFKYPDTELYVLRNCSFVLKKEKSYAFVGINGAGKSTIIKLLAGLYDGYEGDILLNGRSIKDYDYAELKGLISILFQDFTTYSITVKENITIGNNMIDNQGKMDEILLNIGLTDLIENLKYGINASLGRIKENSVDISLGQKQRLAIARVLYSESKIIILDEPTASLDPIAESQVYEMFHRINCNRFTIYITHRLGAAKIADEILVLNEGCIAESGSHEQLLSNHNGLYHKMFTSQRFWYE